MSKRIPLSPVTVSITLPTAMPEHARIEARAVGVLADLCGGCTIARGEGAYTMAAGEVVREGHTMVWAYVSQDIDPSAVNDAVRGLAEYALEHSGEECILACDLSGPGLYFRD